MYRHFFLIVLFLGCFKNVKLYSQIFPQWDIGVYNIGSPDSVGARYVSNGYITQELHFFVCIGDTIKYTIPTDMITKYNIIDANTISYSNDSTYLYLKIIDSTQFSRTIVIMDYIGSFYNNLFCPVYILYRIYNPYMRRWEKSFNNYITLAIFHIRCCDDKIYKHKLSSNRTSICYGDTTLLKVDSDYKKLRWNTGDTTSTIIARQWGRYYCIGWNSCRADTQYVDIEPDCSCIDSFGIPKTLTLCGTESKTVTAKGSPTLRYQWSTGDTTARITVKEQGVYYITASNLCTTFLDTLVVTQKPIATPAEQSFEIVYPATVVLSACYESDRYRWLPTPEACGDCKQINVKPTKAITNYVVEVRSDDGCMDSCVYTIHTSGIYGTIYIPNAFSPNGDGQNDLLKIFTDNSRLINFQIYNRWGELVFSSDSQSPQWDGKYKNENAPSGIYTYQVQYIQGIETSVRSLKGSIMLIR